MVSEPRLKRADAIVDQEFARVAEVDPTFANWRSNFSEQRRLMREEPLSPKTLETAVVIWRLFPFYLSAVAGAERDSDFGLDDDLESLLHEYHEDATRALMRLAHHVSMNFAPFDIAGRYCRQIMRDRWKKQYPLFDQTNGIEWPDCLGDELLNLAPDVRSEIMSCVAGVELLKLVWEHNLTS